MRRSVAVRQLTPSSSLSSQLLLFLLPVLVPCGRVTSVVGDSGAFYTDRWAVQVRGGEDVARRLAADHGFEFIAKVRSSFVALYSLNVSVCKEVFMIAFTVNDTKR